MFNDILMYLNEQKGAAYYSLKPFLEEKGINEENDVFTDAIEELKEEEYIKEQFNMDGFDKPRIQSTVALNGNVTISAEPSNPGKTYKVTKLGRDYIEEKGKEML